MVAFYIQGGKKENEIYTYIFMNSHTYIHIRLYREESQKVGDMGLPLTMVTSDGVKEGAT